MNHDYHELPDSLADILALIESSEAKLRSRGYSEIEICAQNFPKAFCQRVLVLYAHERDPTVRATAGPALEKIYEALRQFEAAQKLAEQAEEPDTPDEDGDALDESDAAGEHDQPPIASAEDGADDKPAEALPGLLDALKPPPDKPLGIHGGSVSHLSICDAHGRQLIGPWLWDSFKNVSALVDAHGGHYKRDELAQGEIRARLSHNDNPLLQIKRYYEYSDRALELLTQSQYNAICVLGRPGLQGPVFKALIRYCLQNLYGDANLSAEPLNRFDFPIDRRPRSIGRHQINNRQYHYMIERHGNGKLTYLRTTEDKTHRYDYGIVQRYRLQCYGRPVDIVICAGNSSLATLGAARYAALQIFPHGANQAGPSIYLPETFTVNSKLEALVKVTADKTTQTWENLQIDLLKLYMSDGGVEQLWIPQSATWLKAPPDLIKLHQDHLDLHYFKKVDQLSTSTIIGRLAWHLARYEQGRPHKHLTVNQLGCIKEIWTGAAATTPRIRAQQQLANLRNRFFGESLKIDSNEEVRLTCPIKIC